MDDVIDRDRIRRVLAPDSTVFDRSFLGQYTAGDAALEAELIGLFLGQLPQILVQVSGAKSAADWKFAFHSLRGAAAAIGARELTALAEVHESKPILDHPGNRASLVDKIAGAAERFEAETRRVIGTALSSPA
jgi:HPt (histidine-containing phosphotransfer) domain-containing protein